MQHNVPMKKARAMVLAILKDPYTSAEGRQWAREMLNNLRDAQINYEDALDELRMHSYRLPAFDDDYVGWLPDDFDDEDDDD